VVFNAESATITAANLAAEFVTDTSAAFDDSVTKTVIIVGDKDGGAKGQIWFVDNSLDGDATSVTTGDLVLVGTLNTNIDIDAITGNQIF